MSAYSVIVIVCLILWSFYRRIKRNIGLQDFRVKGLIVRTIIFSILGIFALASIAVNPINGLYELIGMIIGGVILFYAIKHTTYEKVNDKWKYRPNTKVSMIVIAVFFCRFAYRMYMMFELAKSTPTMQAQNANPYSGVSKDPLTLAALCLMITYYIGYYVYLLRKKKKLESPVENEKDIQ